MPFSAPPAHFPDGEVADYLERYAERFDLPVRLRTRVDALAWDGERYVATAGDRRFEADSVVVATGPFQRPRVAAGAAQLAPESRSCTRANTMARSRSPTAGARVGAGNSGAQIALELARHRDVCWPAVTRAACRAGCWDATSSTGAGRS